MFPLPLLLSRSVFQIRSCGVNHCHNQSLPWRRQTLHSNGYECVDVNECQYPGRGDGFFDFRFANTTLFRR